MNQEEASLTNTMTLLGRLKDQMPELWNQAEVVGRWIWLEFNIAPEPRVRTALKELGFHWNSQRKCWQHPCGVSRGRSRSNPREFYRVTSPADLELKEAIPRNQRFTAKEFKVVALRECPLPEDMQICDTPEKAADYWRLHVQTIPHFSPDCECFAILMLNTRRRVKGHQLISIGTLDTILVHPREVFRTAIAVGGVSALILGHNHPSGEPDPSEADIKVTRDLIRAGQLLKIEVIDHIIIGAQRHCSLREMGFFY